MIRVLFVCLGNICRSPMAEGIFQHLLHEEGMTDQFYCDSAGTSNYHLGKRPDSRTLQVLEQKGIRTRHRARQILHQDLESFDYLIAMDESNFRHLERMHLSLKAPRAQIRSMIDFIPMAHNPQNYTAIPDPYYGDLSDFEEVYNLLYPGCQNLLTELSHSGCMREGK